MPYNFGNYGGGMFGGGMFGGGMSPYGAGNYGMGRAVPAFGGTSGMGGGGMSGMFSGGGMFGPPQMPRQMMPQMQMPRMMFNRPMQAPQNQFSAGGGDPRNQMPVQAGADGTLGGDRSPQFFDEAARRAAFNGGPGGDQSFSQGLGGAPQPPTQNPNMGTGGGSPFEPSMNQGGKIGMEPSQPPMSGADMMAQQMRNIGGYGMQAPQPPQISQAPQNQFSAGGGDPYTPQISQAPQVQTGGASPYQPDPPQGGMGGMGALRGFGANGMGGYRDPSAGWNMTGNFGTPPSHPAPPMGSQETPGWMQGNPMMGAWLGGGANSWGTLNGRGPWSWQR